MNCPKCGKEVYEGAQFCQHCGANLQEMAPPHKPKRSPAIIALIIAGIIIGIIIIGIIAAIAIPNLIVANQGVKQKKTMSDMRSMAIAIEMYQVDFRFYPICRDLDELGDVLVPEYTQMIPTVDGWGNLFEYELKGEGEGYCLISFGKNGVRDTFEPYPKVHQAFSGFDQDIIFCNGEFISYPK